MKTALIVIGIVLALAGLEAGNQYLTIRSDLMAQRKEAREEWSNVGEALEHRAALISDLTTYRSLGDKAVAASQDIASARQAMARAHTPREKMAANQRLSKVLAPIMAEADNNLRLQSDQAFVQWKDELAKCEDHVAVERNRYNRMLERYNARIQQFPDSLVASIAGFRRDDAYFKTQDAISELPKKQP
jgi:LemA protein